MGYLCPRALRRGFKHRSPQPELGTGLAQGKLSTGAALSSPRWTPDNSSPACKPLPPAPGSHQSPGQTEALNERSPPPILPTSSQFPSSFHTGLPYTRTRPCSLPAWHKRFPPARAHTSFTSLCRYLFLEAFPARAAILPAPSGRAPRYRAALQARLGPN